MKQRSLIFSALAAGALFLAGCTVGPHYERPKPKMPATFEELQPTRTNQVSEATGKSESLEDWWRTFNDPILDDLIRQAMHNNRNLQIALARIRQARAQRGVVASGLFPEIDATGGFIRSRGSENVELPLGGASGSGGSANGTASGSQSQTPAVSSRSARSAKSQTMSPKALSLAGAGASAPTSGASGGGGSAGAGFAQQPGGPLTPFGKGGLPGVTSDLYQVGFDSSWEIDVFGGIRRGIEAADADTAAAVENYRSVLVSLLGDVASTYIQLRSAQYRLDIARQNLVAQKAILSIVQAKAHAGLSTDLEVAQQAAQVSSVTAVVPSLESQAREALHNLAFLLGQDTTRFGANLELPQPLPSLPPQVPVGIPGELLRRRPDIRQAERQLAAATARVGVARADYYPKFNLTSAVGFDSTKAENLFDWGSRYFALNPGVSWPVLDWGRIRNNVKAQNALQQQALLRYENTVQQAVMEVENALVQFQTEQSRRQNLADAVKHDTDAFQLARQQYESGVVDFLTILDVQRALFAAQEQLCQSDASVRTSLVSLYKALGGGWKL